MARILLIDDDNALREVLAMALTEAGHVVTQARDGKEGVDLFRMEPAELIITDLIMPGREGIETIMMLRREQPELPVIAISGGMTNSAFYLKLAAGLGARRTLAKPFAIAELVGAVAEVLAAAGRSPAT
jgi:DNA-binding response OmpR family regulator